MTSDPPMQQPDVVLEAEGLGKRYLLSHARPVKARTFREAVWSKVTGLTAALTARHTESANRPPESTRADGQEEFWALSDISFSLRGGDRLGIIGRNGAGKSTLLKILSRVVTPTAGRARLRGRVGSLLEVGTGFHPELTGRENIFLNGSILGMTQEEIKRNFDEIVAFAEVERFLDTPVKRYSSGMYVRLAFAVASHLETEILIVDEVLAVGDVQFQKRCLTKMGQVSQEGRTLLFVSHNMAAISRICSTGLVLHEGRQTYFGPVDGAIKQYLDQTTIAEASFQDLTMATGAAPRPNRYLRWVSTHRGDGTATTGFRTGDAVVIRCGVVTPNPIQGFLHIIIVTRLGERVASMRSTHRLGAALAIEGACCIECRVDSMNLATGEYIVQLYFGQEYPKEQTLDSVLEAIKIRFDVGDYLNGFDQPTAQAPWVLRPTWTTQPDPRPAPTSAASEPTPCTARADA